MGAEDTAHAAADRLRLLATEFTTPRRTPHAGPPGRTRPTTPAAPADLDTLDHLTRTFRELVAEARQIVPAGEPRPQDMADYYTLMRDHQPADEEPARRLVREAMVERHALEHAIAIGETSEIRKLTCPACRCWGLFWQAPRQAAVCVNRRCKARRRGRPAQWTLGQLAEYIVEKRERGATAI